MPPSGRVPANTPLLGPSLPTGFFPSCLLGVAAVTSTITLRSGPSAPSILCRAGHTPCRATRPGPGQGPTTPSLSPAPVGPLLLPRPYPDLLLWGPFPCGALFPALSGSYCPVGGPWIPMRSPPRRAVGDFYWSILTLSGVQRHFAPSLGFFYTAPCILQPFLHAFMHTFLHFCRRHVCQHAS